MLLKGQIRLHSFGHIEPQLRRTSLIFPTVLTTLTSDCGDPEKLQGEKTKIAFAQVAKGLPIIILVGPPCELFFLQINNISFQ